MPAQHKGSHVFHADLQLFRNEGPEARGIEHAGHADNSGTVEFADLICRLGHGVQRIGDHDKNAIGRRGDAFADHILHDLVVGVEQVVAAHPRLAREAGSDHHNVGVCSVGVIIGATHCRIALFDGHGLQQIEAFALRHAFDNIDEHNIGQFFAGDPVSGGSADIAGAHNGDFLAHVVSLERFRISRG